MMFRIIRLSFGDVFRPELRSLLLKSMGLAILFLFLIWLGVQWLAAQAITLPYAWLDLGLSILASVGLFLIAIYFVPAVTSLVAGFFLDDIAKHIERIHYGEAGVGKEMAVLPSLIMAVQFTFLVIIMNLFALILLLIPGVNAIIFLVVNGYLLGREYFEMAVRRHVSTETAIMLRQKHGPRLMLYGLAIAGYLAIPILNLTAPLFATAMMVHLVADIRHKGFLN